MHRDVPFCYAMVRVAVFVIPPMVPVMVAVVFELALVVLTLKMPVVFPAPMVTVVGTVTEDSLLCSVTISPPVGAGLLRVTVPDEAFPAATFVGPTFTETSAGELMVSVAAAEVPSHKAEMEAVFCAETAIVLTVTTPEDLPAGIVKVVGTVTELSVLARVTFAPPAGATPVRETVAFVALPP